VIKQITHEQIREGAAYHEAGHAVIATTCGWSVNHEGVEIDDRAYTGLEVRRFQYRTSDQIHVNLAGWLSEYKFHGLGGLRENKELQNMLEMIRTPASADEDDIGSDDFLTFEALLKDHPNALDEELIAKYRKYQNDVMDELDEPVIWNAIETLAALLLEKGKVECDEANELIEVILDAYRKRLPI
jgi:hypothetical protein